jgi:hypothetical protein
MLLQRINKLDLKGQDDVGIKIRTSKNKKKFDPKIPFPIYSQREVIIGIMSLTL